LNAIAIATEKKDILILEKLEDGSRVIRIMDKSTNHNWDNYLTDNQGKYIRLIRPENNLILQTTVNAILSKLYHLRSIKI